jgi:hypothetical protein
LWHIFDEFSRHLTKMLLVSFNSKLAGKDEPTPGNKMFMKLIMTVERLNEFCHIQMSYCEKHNFSTS